MPGIGKVLALTILYEVEDIHRFQRVQQFVSYARLVKGHKESAGKRTGTMGAKMGNRHLKWAFSEATVLLLRESARAKQYLQRMESKHSKGKALSIRSATSCCCSRSPSTRSASSHRRRLSNDNEQQDWAGAGQPCA